jgi:hypothetical protein
VKIGKLFDFTANSKQPITARRVTLLDEDGRSIELEDLGLGNYALNIPRDHPDFPVELGKYYHLRVETFDNRTFESEPEQGVAVPKMQNLSYRFVERLWPNALGEFTPREIIQFNIDTPLRTEETGSELFLNWQTEWTFKVLDSPFQPGIEQKTCYITENLGITSINLIDSRSYTTDSLSDHAVYENIVSRHFGEGLVFTVIQRSLSEKAYTYFEQVAENTFRDGSMFERPPGRVISNFYNINDSEEETFGFFFVTEQDTIRRYISPEEVGSPPFYCPPPNGIVTQSGYCAESICCDCLSVERSTLTVPDFWEE